MDEVNATVAVEGVVAAFAIDGIVAAAAEDHIGEGGADDHLTGVADAIGIEHVAAIDIVAGIAIKDLVEGRGADITGAADGGVNQVARGIKHFLVCGGGLQVRQRCHCGRLAHISHLDPAVRYGEGVGIEPLGSGVAHQQIGHQGAVDVVVEELGKRNPVQVVQVVATLQRHVLHGEDHIEQASEHAAHHLALRQAADPGVDVVEVLVGGAAGTHPGGVSEGCRSCRLDGGHVVRLLRCIGAFAQGVPLSECGVTAVSGASCASGSGAELGEEVISGIGHHEVLTRGVLVVQAALERVAEAGPALVGIEGGLQQDGCQGLDCGPHFVERGLA